MNRDIIDKLRREYPKGTKIELIHMEDSQAPRAGSIGFVDHVDDYATIHMHWQTGSSLGLIPEVDEFKVIEEVQGC